MSHFIEVLKPIEPFAVYSRNAVIKHYTKNAYVYGYYCIMHCKIIAKTVILPFIHLHADLVAFTSHAKMLCCCSAQY